MWCEIKNEWLDLAGFTWIYLDLPGFGRICGWICLDLAGLAGWICLDFGLDLLRSLSGGRASALLDGTHGTDGTNEAGADVSALGAPRFLNLARLHTVRPY